MDDVLSLNACLLPTHLRWQFRAHRLVFCEATAHAAHRVAAALIAHHRVAPFNTVHLQEVFEEVGFDVLAERLRAVGLVYTTGFARSGLCTFSTWPLRVLFERETKSLGEVRPKAWQAIELGAGVMHVNLHFASEIDGSHAGRLAQAAELAAWVTTRLRGPDAPRQLLVTSQRHHLTASTRRPRRGLRHNCRNCRRSSSKRRCGTLRAR